MWDRFVPLVDSVEGHPQRRGCSKPCRLTQESIERIDHPTQQMDMSPVAEGKALVPHLTRKRGDILRDTRASTTGATPSVDTQIRPLVDS